MSTRLLDNLDVAERLAVTSRQATRMMNAGHLPTIRIGKSEVRVPSDALERWIREHTVDPTTTRSDA